MPYILTNAAKADVIRLYAEGSEAFGDDKAEAYYADMTRVFGLLGRHPSTIGRELKRNSLAPVRIQTGDGGTDGAQRAPKIERLSPLKTHIPDRLAMEQSPEQIAGRLKLTRSEHTISAEKIYARIYGPYGRCQKLHRLLPQAKSRRGRRAGKGRRLPAIPDRLPIHMRPTKAHLRAEPGHCEADLRHFRGQKACLLTCVERRSRLLFTTAMTDKSADTTAQALAGLLEKIPKKARKTVTLDNGGEFYRHKQLPVRAFFCDPHCPWQRGSVENANGVIRRSLPRSCKLDNFSNHDIEDITWTYNTTPRKCLGFLTPIEACAKSIGVPAGLIMNYKTGEKAVKWVSTGNELTEEQRIELRREAGIRADEQFKAMVERHRTAGKRAYGMWANGVEADRNHPYLQKKQIEAAGMKMVPDSKTLMVPMQDAKGKIWSVQFIDEKGEKRFIKEGRKEGLFHPFGDLKDDAKQFYIAEGVATAATIHHATGKPTLAAFDCGNLKPVAEAIKKQYPDAAIVIAADNDHNHKFGKNVGMMKAEEAAKAVEGAMVAPKFTDAEKAKGLTDFNDLAVERGLQSLAGDLKPAKVKTAEKAQAL